MAATPAPLATTKEPTTAQRKLFAKMGLAMPDGSFYIRNGPVGAADLGNAIEAVGRGEDKPASGDSIRRFIMKRAKALGLTSKIPDTWNADGSLKQDAFEEEAAEFLEHFGVKGMHWGVERSRTARTDDNNKSADAARARATADTIKKHGVNAVSNADLQHLVNRSNLEKQHASLSTANRSDGKKFLDKLVDDQVNAAQKEANKVIGEYAVKGALWLGKEATKQLLGTKSGTGKHT